MEDKGHVVGSEDNDYQSHREQQSSPIMHQCLRALLNLSRGFPILAPVLEEASSILLPIQKQQGQPHQGCLVMSQQAESEKPRSQELIASGQPAVINLVESVETIEGQGQRQDHDAVVLHHPREAKGDPLNGQ